MLDKTLLWVLSHNYLRVVSAPSFVHLASLLRLQVGQLQTRQFSPLLYVFKSVKSFTPIVSNHQADKVQLKQLERDTSLLSDLGYCLIQTVLHTQGVQINRSEINRINMFPFPHQGPRGAPWQQSQSQWMPMNMNGNGMNMNGNGLMNTMNQPQMFLQPNMFMQIPQGVPFPATMNNQLLGKGSGPRFNSGNQFNHGRNQVYQQQQFQYSQYNNRQKNNKRKSSDTDLSDRYTSPKMSRPANHQLPQPSRNSANIRGSKAMHMPLVNGAKPIVHIPGQSCQRITEAIVEYYNDYHQSEEDLRHKVVLSNCLYAIVRDIFPGCRLFIVGSSLSGFGTRTSDMDLCLLVTQIQYIDQKYEAVHILNAIHKSLRNCSFVKSSQVIKAKVPILKFTDSKKNIECDLNINNGVGIRNTHLLKYYCLADNRVAPLMLFIKFWARFHDINDAHKRTISSYSLALMLIHYLQVCSPPVLPCLQRDHPEFFDSRIDLRNMRLDDVLPHKMSQNTGSLGELFQGFLNYYAFEFRPDYDVISVRQGCILNKQMVQRMSSEPHQWKCLCVEEPFDRSNTARSVFDPNIFLRVQQVFRRSAETLKKRGDVAAILSHPF